MNRQHSVVRSMWHRSHAFYSRNRRDSVRLMRNQNRSPFVVSLDLHHAPKQSVLVALHLATYKSVVRSMAHCHAETRMVNDDDRLNRIHATTMDKSVSDRKRTRVKHLISCNSDSNIHVIGIKYACQMRWIYLFSVNLFCWRLFFFLYNHWFDAGHFYLSVFLCDFQNSNDSFYFKLFGLTMHSNFYKIIRET